MGHEHALGGPAGARHIRALSITFGLVVVFMVVEGVAGLLTNSLALLSDAGHMLTDAVGLGMALGAITVGRQASGGRGRTFGLYRLEVLAALANALLLFAVAAYVLFEAYGRFAEPPPVDSAPMLLVAVAGLMANLIGWRLLRDGAAESLNVEGALLEVLGDMLGSVGVIAAALITLTTGWAYADPLFGAGIGLFILPRAWMLGKKSLRVLLQAAPNGLDLDSLRLSMREIDGVIDVHDVHVWTLTSGMDVASMHLKTADSVDPHAVLDSARDLLRANYGIAHATLQVEPETHDDCSETW